MSKCKVIAISNHEGGLGKTTITFNLGVALANKGNRVLISRCRYASDKKTRKLTLPEELMLIS